MPRTANSAAAGDRATGEAGYIALCNGPPAVMAVSSKCLRMSSDNPKHRARSRQCVRPVTNRFLRSLERDLRTSLAQPILEAPQLILASGIKSSAVKAGTAHQVLCFNFRETVSLLNSANRGAEVANKLLLDPAHKD